MSLFESTKQTEICPQCHALLQIKRGKQGLFLGCTAYPECDYIRPLHQSTHVIKTLDEECPDCGFPLQLKQGAFGIFIGCSHYPECHFIVHEQEEIEPEFDCPQCQKHKLVKRSGRAGKSFYGCTGYPKCKFTLSVKPIEKTCPECGCSLVVAKKQQYQCVNKSCQHLFSEPEINETL